MTYLQPTQRPRIVMLDCADDLVSSITRAGYAVEAGYTGYFAEHPSMEIPDRLHEKELLVVDLDPGWTPRPAFDLFPYQSSAAHVPVGDHAREPRRNAEPLARFTAALDRGGVIIVLMEGATPPVAFDPDRSSLLRGGSLDWIPGAQTMRAARGIGQALATINLEDDALKVAPSAIAELDESEHPDDTAFFGGLIDLLRGHPEARSLRTLVGCKPLLVNDAGEAKAGYVVTGNGGPGLILLLPYFRRKAAVLHRLLDELLPALDSEVFPRRDRTAWHDDDAYQVAQVQDARRQRAEVQARLEQQLRELDEAEAEARDEGAPFTAILTSRGPELRAAVAHVLTWLGFGLDDVDAEHEAAGIPNEEDFRAHDVEGWIACVEVLASQGNVRQKDYQDLRTYMGQRARDERFAGGDIRGILIVNQEWRDPPASRTPLWGTDGRDWDRIAAEDGVAAIATWDLFQLCMAVQRGEIGRDAVREMLKGGGIVTAS